MWTNSAAALWLWSPRRNSARRALVSASSFTLFLLRPTVEVVVVIHRFVAKRVGHRADERVCRIVAEGERHPLLAAPEVALDRLAHQRRRNFRRSRIRARATSRFVLFTDVDKSHRAD
jgi:hypothetical protein